MTMWIITNCEKVLNRWEYQTTLTMSWETCVQIKKPQLKPDMKQQTGSKLLSPCLFNFYAEYIMWHAGLDETQAVIKFARRNINNLRYADDANLMTESKKELKSLLMKMKEESEKLASNSTFRN